MAASFREIRVLHAGDIELDSPFSTSDRAESERRRDQVRRTIRDLFSFVRERGVEIVLLSGNLFDSEYATDETAAFLLDGMAACPDTRFFVAPGPRDANAEGTLYQAYAVPANVTVFRRAHAERVDLPEWGVSVCGWAYLSPATTSRPAARPFERGDCPILLACGYTSPGGVSVTEADLAACGAVYVGLSDGRDFDGFHHVGTTAWALSGPPEARDFSHKQFGGVNLLTLRIPVPETDAADAAQAADKAAPDPTSETEIDKKEKEPPADGSDAPTDEARSDADRPGEATADGAKADGDTTARDDRETADDEGTGAFGLSTGAALLSRDGCELYGERMLIGCRRYVTVDLPLDGMTSEAEVEGAIREIVRQGEYGKETSLLVRFGGHTSPDFLPRTPGDKTTYGLAELVCVDLSLPDSDENGYARDMSVRGEMVRAFAPALADDDPDKKEIAAEALRIAFAALDNKDISHL